MSMTPPPDPVAFLMDAIYTFNLYTTDFLQKTAKEFAENPQLQTATDWVLQQRDQILNGISDLPKNINLSKVPVPRDFQKAPPAPVVTPFKKVTTWIADHKVVTATVLIGATTVAAGFYFNAQMAMKAKSKKRRARKAANGARIEAVVLASSPREPIAKIIAADLERRGFIVFMTVQPGEEHLVLKEDSPDIRPLIMPSYDSASCNDVVNKFADLVDRQQHLAGVIIIPDLYYPTGPVESISAYDWTEILYTKIVGSVGLFSQGFIPLVRRHNARFIMLTPSILSSLCPPFHAPECVTASALSTFALCMQRELAPQGIHFIHMRLGSFDFAVPSQSNYTSAPQSPYMSPSSGRGVSTPSHARSYSPATSPARSVTNSIRADLLSWPENIRNVYGRAYSSAARAISGHASWILPSISSSSENKYSGSPISELSNAIFDSLTSESRSALRRTQFVGQGSFMYYLLGDILPEIAVEWVLGLTKAKYDVESSGFYRTVHLEKCDPLPTELEQPLVQSLRAQGDDNKDSLSGSAYNSETESNPADLASSWERV
ncbi:uncharacterized protein V1518DRAFT_402990 [Limtongia smithiae]|uniref:uncharacterized protein n=1 Tax=Limtongia smithiae TaxID=1125753 RepID=UPI0034CE27DC